MSSKQHQGLSTGAASGSHSAPPADDATDDHMFDRSGSLVGGVTATSESADIPPELLALMGADATTATRDGATRDGGLGQLEALEQSYQSGDIIGQYELIRALGRGGMGEVFLARDTRLGRLVAIKILSGRGELRADRFLAEARATARCRHESIVVIHDVGQVGGRPYMVLEYLRGPTLHEWLRERQEVPRARDAARDTAQEVAQDTADLPPARTAGKRDRCWKPVPPTRAVELMVPVVRALARAHALGIVHRDLKPRNIILADTGTVKVLDFGIAKLLDRQPIAFARVTAPHPVDAQADLLSLDGMDSDPWSQSELAVPETTDRGALMGTLPYMAPEQHIGAPVDQRCDIWAAGIILYELAVGHHPLDPLTRRRLRSIGRLQQAMPSAVSEHPNLGPLAAVIDRCLQKVPDDRYPTAVALLAALEPLLAHQLTQLSDDQSPFAGLSAFQSDDAARFFGRERDIASAITRLHNKPMLTITGPSGSGKSSFARAGIIPALQRLGDGWQAVLLRPGRHPLTALASAISQAGLGPQGEATVPMPRALAASWRTQPGSVGSLLRARCRRARMRIVVVIDQFEELYTLCADDDERSAFFACLEGVADDASSPLRVVLTLRSDFLERMADDRELLSRVTRALHFLAPMPRSGLRAALTRPLAQTGYEFESGHMVEDILDDLQDTRSPLPLLQFTAARLWELRDRQRQLMTRASYRDIGGVGGALAVHAEQVTAGFTRSEQALMRAVLLSLVTPERTRAVVSTDELDELCNDPDRVQDMLRRLADARLVLLEADSDGATAELAHESLIDKWSRLRSWLDDNEDDAAFLARLRPAAEQWAAHGYNEGMLWTGQAAQDAREWLERLARQGADEDDETGVSSVSTSLSGLVIGIRAERFLDAVLALDERIRRRRRFLVASALVGLLAIALVVSFFAVRANRAAQRAEQQAARAAKEADRVRAQQPAIERSAMRARNATRMAAARDQQADPTTVVALLREMEPGHQPRGWETLARSALHRGVARVVLAHPDIVRTASFSRDGTRIVTACADRIARVYSADGLQPPIVLRGHTDRVYAASFSPDGERVVTASADHTARIFSSSGRGSAVVLHGHTDRVYDARFSPDGTQVVTASGDRTARVHRPDMPAPAIVLRGHTDRVFSAAFNPAGTHVVTGSSDRTARIQRADGAGEATVLRGHGDRLHTAEFNSEGTLVVTSSADHTVRVFRADGTGVPLVLRDHRDRVYSATFSPDGRRIASAAGDQNVYLWDIVVSPANGDLEQPVAVAASYPLELSGHGDRINSAAFSPDGTLVVTASDDQTVRVYSTDASERPLVLRGHDDRVYDASYDPAGRRIVTASADNSARIYDSDGDWLGTLQGHTERVQHARFSADSRNIVTTSLDRTARVWPADISGEYAGSHIVLTGHQDDVLWAEFSLDGTRVVTASADRTARIWRSDGTGTPIVLAGHAAAVASAAFSPDGTRVVTASWDQTVRIWDADGTGDPEVLVGHGGRAYSASFDPTGTFVVSASEDKTAWIWNLDRLSEPVFLTGHDAQVRSAVFSPDGTRVVTASDDMTVRIFAADGGAPAITLRGPRRVINSASFSPDGTRVIAASDDSRAWIWTDLTPLTSVDDLRLWRSTSYCMSLSRRQALLDADEREARANRRACLRRAAAEFDL